MDNKELLEKARQAKSPEELLAIANENGVDMNEDSAKAYFEQLRKSGELSDEELGNVSGGGCNYKDGRLIVTVGYSCDYFTCSNCGKQRVKTISGNGYVAHLCGSNRIAGYDYAKCKYCKHMSYEHGLWLCNHPEKRA